MHMKRLLLIAVAWGAALLMPAAHAQSRGMGMRTSAPPARFNSGFAPRPAPSARFSPGFTSRPAPAVVRASPQTRVVVSGGRTFFVPQHRVVFRSFHHFHHRPFFFFNTCFNGFCNPFFFGSAFAPGFYPYSYSYPYDYGYAPPPPQQPVVMNDDSNTRELSQQVERLSDEVERLRDQERSRDEARNSPALQAVAPRHEEPRSITIVFRDGRRETVQNYAIAGNTFWALSESRARKISLTDLDLAATQRENEKNGVEIHLPGKSNTR